MNKLLEKVKSSQQEKSENKVRLNSFISGSRSFYPALQKKMFKKSNVIKAGMTYKEVKVIKNIPKIDLVNILQIVESYKHDKMEGLHKLGNGSYGSVFGYKNYAIKIFYEREHNKDYVVLEKLQGIDLFPVLYCYKEKEFMVMEKVEGVTLTQMKRDDNKQIRQSFINNNSNVLHLLRKVQNDFKSCIERGVYLHDLHDENIMITNNTFMFIDLGHSYLQNSIKLDDYNMFNHYALGVYNVDLLNEVKV